MDSRTKNTSRNIIWGTCTKVMMTIMPFAVRTVMIYRLGIEYTGIHSLFNSILNVLSLAELGFGSALVFSMYKPLAEEDTDKVCALLNLYKKCYRIIGSVILLFGIILLPFVDYLIEGDVPPDINIKIVYVFSLLNTVLSYFLFAYKTSLFTASQRTDITSKIQGVVNFFSYLMQIWAVYYLNSYYAYTIILPIATCVNNIVTEICSRKMFPQYVCRGSIGREDLVDIFKRVAGLVFSKIGGVVLSSADTIIISAFLGLNILGIYSGYYYIITALFGFLSVISNSLIPSVGNSIVKESKEKNYKDFKKFHFMYIWIVSWWCCCLICLYQPFIALWQGQDNMLDFNMVILFGIYFFVYKMGDISYMYREGLGLWWQAKFVPLIAAVVNLVVNIILVQIIGLPGILISTIISVVFVYDPGGSWVLFKYYFEDLHKWLLYLASLVIYALGGFIVAYITYWICSFTPEYGIMTLILRGIICTIVPNLLLLIIYGKTENFKNAYAFVRDKVLVAIKH